MSRNFDDASMDHRSCSCRCMKNAITSSSVGGRDSFVEGVWLVPVVGLVSMQRALRVLQFLRTLSVLAGLGYPGAVGVAAVLVLEGIDVFPISACFCKTAPVATGWFFFAGR